MSTRRAHLSDADLVRILDADPTLAGGADDGAAQSHAAGCAPCAAELRQLGTETALVSKALLDLVPVDVASPLAGRRPGSGGRAGALAGAGGVRPWMKAAIVVLALGAPLLAVEPLRARIGRWVSASWTELASAIAGGEPRSRVTAATSERPAAVVWFTPSGPQLAVRLRGRQIEGALVLERTPGASAALEVVPATGALAPMASERGVDIPNEPASRASYVLRLPAGVERVVAEVGSEPPRVYGAAELRAGARLDLARRPGAR